MRIRVIQEFSAPSIDGIQLERFVPGQSYDVGVMLGSLLLAEGWAEPDDDAPTVMDHFVNRRTPRLLDIAADFSRGQEDESRTPKP